METLLNYEALVAVTTTFAGGAWLLRGVTAGGAFAGFVVALAVFVAAGPGGSAVLIAVFAVAWLTTRLGYRRKMALGSAESAGGRFTAQVPGLATVDFAVDKRFAFGEKRMLSFRTEFFNLLNRANYYNPISNLSTDGVSLNPDFGQIKSSHDPRQIQFPVRFSW